MNAIRILEQDSNRRGDLFGRLIADLFVALGYELPHLNIHKSGREIDVSTSHRLERRRAIGECKATTDRIGGDDINKFVGALDAEHESDIPVTGYFVSLSGFRETALEQERKRLRTKIILLNSEEVVSELIKGRIIISSERAAELAGRLCGKRDDLMLDGAPELIAHDRGWIWIIYYSNAKLRTSYVLVHADGTPLNLNLANEISQTDKICGGNLHFLKCLNQPPSEKLDSAEAIREALSAYAKYIAEECGYIQLDGLPADSDVGSRRLKLENLFVPLHFDIRRLEKVRHQVGMVLAAHPRLALLAAPGGGKSTLIKRLAVAYADPSRRDLIPDGLPEKNWLPLFFRCRELRTLARASFAELLEALSKREPVRAHAEVFRKAVDRALGEGRVLLLVDGLDEISDPGDRAAFVCTLRTALHAYPGTAIVVTSREAGFRHVGAHLASVCTEATLSALSDDDIKRLSVSWHTEVVGVTEKVKSDAEQLARTITANDRIHLLAKNPLLLTTLLLVKRWVGSLPTRRALLYGKAVELLLMTWNTEGHAPIPEDEALPQLCYVASSMMIEGLERVSRPRLSALLQEARNVLPTELGYVKGSVEEFIHRVEDRSSLLMMTGHDVEDGRLTEFFEFRHLTFQEFLTARAMVHGWHPGRKDSDTLITALEPHLDNEKWREVIPLAASLGGKETDGLISRLTNLLETKSDGPRSPIHVALGHCLADEAAARPDTVRTALRALVLNGLGRHYGSRSYVPSLITGRYGDQLREEAEKAFIEPGDFITCASALQEIAWYKVFHGEDRSNPERIFQQAFDLLNDSTVLNRCIGALGIVGALKPFGPRRKKNAILERALNAIVPLLFSEEPRENYVAGWAFYDAGRQGIWQPPSEPDALGQMFNLWRHSPAVQIRGPLATTLASQMLVNRDEYDMCRLVKKEDVSDLFTDYEKISDGEEKYSVLVVAYYRRFYSNSEIIEKVRTLRPKRSPDENDQIDEFLMLLGATPERKAQKSMRSRRRPSFAD